MKSKKKAITEDTLQWKVTEPINPTELARRGWFYYAEQDYTRAREDFVQALQTDPSNIDFQYGLALTYKRMGKPQESVQTFQKINNELDTMEDPVRATMLRRLTLGHINQITQGDWNLGELVWHRKV